MYYTIWFIRNNLLDTMRCDENSLREKIDCIRMIGGEILRIRDIRGDDFTDY